MKKLLLLFSILVSVNVFAGIPLTSNFTMNAALPIEDRMSVTNSTARDAISSLRRWEGMIVYVVADAKHYALKGGITNSDWKDVGSGGGGISNWLTATAYKTNDVVIQSLKIYQALSDHTSGTFATDLSGGKWQEISAQANLTGVITSTGLATSFGTFTSAEFATGASDESGTGKIILDTAPTVTNANLVTPTLGVATGTSLTAPTLIGGTGASSTLALKSTSGTGITDAIILGVGTNGATEAMRATTAGNIGIGTNAPSATTILEVASTTKASIPAPKMTTAQMTAIASPLAGMQVYNTDLKAVATYNGTTWQYGFGNIAGDTVYSANVSASGAVSNLNKPSWITSCTVASPSVCTLGAGITLTQGMNCVANFSNGIQRGINQSASSTTTISFQEYLPSSNTSITLDSSFNVVCQKTGTDYTNASAQVFATTNNSIEKAGTILATSGASCGSGYLLADGSAVSRTTYATLFAEIGITHGQGDGSTTFNLPDYRGRFLRGIDGSAGRDADKATRTAMATGANTGNNVGSVQADEVIAHIHNGALMLDGNKVGAGSGDMGYAARAGISNQSTTPNTVYGGSETRPKNVYVNYCVRTTTGSTIVGSFAGYGKAPGLDVSSTPNLDTFSFSYGTTNATTVCSASPCSYLDQIGTAVTSITRASTGNYTLNFAKTYTKVKCVAPLLNCAGSNYCGGVSLGCTGSTCSFPTYTTGAAASADTNGTIMCQGSY